MHGREAVLATLTKATADSSPSRKPMHTPIPHPAAHASFLRLEQTSETKALRKRLAELQEENKRLKEGGSRIPHADPAKLAWLSSSLEYETRPITSSS